MVYLAFCFIGWTLVFSCLFWRSLSIVKQAVNHLQRLHQIPCDKCLYFTGDYRLKCTVNPLVALTETAIGCRDFARGVQASVGFWERRFLPKTRPPEFIRGTAPSPNEQRTGCGSCIAMHHCSNAHQKPQPSVFKLKLPKLTTNLK
jgi:hypothetical protein